MVFISDYLVTAKGFESSFTCSDVSTSSCDGILDWIGDSYCDDDLNNIQCNYDGGDCCNNVWSSNGTSWDQYCTVCDCFEPIVTTDSPMECIGNLNCNRMAKENI